MTHETAKGLINQYVRFWRDSRQHYSRAKLIEVRRRDAVVMPLHRHRGTVVVPLERVEEWKSANVARADMTARREHGR